MIRLIIALLLVGHCSSLVLAQPQTTPLVGAHSQWPPYVMKDGTGLTDELVGAVFADQGIEFNMQVAPFSRAIRMLEQTKIDLIPALWWTAQRAETILFSDPYFDNQLSVITKNTLAINFTGADSLQHLTISTIRGYGYHDFLQTIKGLTVVQLSDLHACLEQVQKGRVDVALADSWAARYEIMQDSQLAELTILQPVLITRALHIGVHKSHPQAKQIISAFNRGLQNIRRSGEYAQISARYEQTLAIPP